MGRQRQTQGPSQSTAPSRTVSTRPDPASFPSSHPPSFPSSDPSSHYETRPQESKKPLQIYVILAREITPISKAQEERFGEK
jgi:hypothetical protein